MREQTISPDAIGGQTRWHVDFAIGLGAGVLAYTTSFIVTSTAECLGCFAFLTPLAQPLFTGIALGWANPKRRLASHLVTAMLVWISLQVGVVMAFRALVPGGEAAPTVGFLLLVGYLPVFCVAILFGLAGLVLSRTYNRVFMNCRKTAARSFLIPIAAIVLSELVYISIFQDVSSLIRAKVELTQKGQIAPDLARALFDIGTRAAVYNNLAVFKAHKGDKAEAQRLFDKSRRWIDRAPRKDRGKLLGELATAEAEAGFHKAARDIAHDPVVDQNASFYMTLEQIEWGALDEAIQNLDLIHQPDRRFLVLVRVATGYALRDRREDAARTFRMAEDIAKNYPGELQMARPIDYPGQFSNRIMLVEEYLTAGFYDDAIRWMSPADLSGSTSVVTQFWLALESAGIEWARLGKVDRAREAFAMDLKLHEGSPSYTYPSVAEAQRTAGLSADAQATDALISEMKRKEEASPPTPAAKQ